MKKNEWAWAEVSSEVANGPFSSKKACIKSALKENKTHREILIGNIYHFRPEDFVDVDVEEVLSSIELRAYDDAGSSFDDYIFSLNCPHDQAFKSLHSAIKRWAKKCVASDKWMIANMKSVKI